MPESKETDDRPLDEPRQKEGPSVFPGDRAGRKRPSDRDPEEEGSAGRDSS